MEESTKCFDDRKILESKSQVRRPLQDKEHILARCKIDHLNSPSLSQKKNITCYHSSFSPPKMQFHHNAPHLEKELEMFRKYEISSSLRLPTITDKTQYQNLYNGQPHSKIMRSTEKDSWFLKSQWPEKLTSIYQKDFAKKVSSNCNSINKLRVNYNNLQVFDLHSSPKGLTQYQQEFKNFRVKPQLKLAIGNKDHLMGKENSFATSQSQMLHKKYQSDFNVSVNSKKQLGFGRKINPKPANND